MALLPTTEKNDHTKLRLLQPPPFKPPTIGKRISWILPPDRDAIAVAVVLGDVHITVGITVAGGAGGASLVALTADGRVTAAGWGSY